MKRNNHLDELDRGFAKITEKLQHLKEELRLLYVEDDLEENEIIKGENERLREALRSGVELVHRTAWDDLYIWAGQDGKAGILLDNDTPTFETRIENGMQVFVCPKCGEKRYHSIGDGHRVSHCSQGCWPHGYFVKAAKE